MKIRYARLFLATFGVIYVFFPTLTYGSEDSILLGQLRFVSGDVVEVRHAENQIDIRIFLDESGNPDEQVLTLRVKETTDITDGQLKIPLEKIGVGAEVDLEYDESQNASYIFVYDYQNI